MDMRRLYWSFRIVVIGAVVLGAMSGSCFAHPAEGVSSGQRDRLKALGAQTKDRAERVRDEMKRARMDLFQVYQSYNLDERKAKAAMERVSKAQLNLLNMHLDDEVALRGVLGESQFSQFAERMGKRMGEFHPHGDAFGEHPPDADMLRGLGLSPDQAKRLKKAVGPGREMIQVIEKLRRDSKQLFDLYAQYNLDTAAAKRLIAGIHDSQQQLSDLHHKAEIATRQTLSEDQFNQLRDLRAEQMRNRPHKEHFRRD